MSTNEQLTYLVNGMSCGHCEASVKEEVGALAGVSGVDVDLATKLVRVSGEQLNDEAIRAAIDEAGYEAAPA
jgi:copper chaperone